MSGYLRPTRLHNTYKNTRMRDHGPKQITKTAKGNAGLNPEILGWSVPHTLAGRMSVVQGSHMLHVCHAGCATAYTHTWSALQASVMLAFKVCKGGWADQPSAVGGLGELPMPRLAARNVHFEPLPPAVRC